MRGATNSRLVLAKGVGTAHECLVNGATESHFKCAQRSDEVILNSNLYIENG